MRLRTILTGAQKRGRRAYHLFRRLLTLARRGDGGQSQSTLIGDLEPLSPRYIRAWGSMEDPPTVSASAAGFMRDEDVVLGIDVGGETRAYPWWILTKYHVANDIVGRRPVMVLLCALCSSAMAFDPIVGGSRLRFEVAGMHQGTFAVRDRQTASVWSPFLGKALQGPLKGAQLRLMPLEQMEWRAWRSLHSDTQVLAAHLGIRGGKGSRAQIGKPGVPQLLRRTIQHWDARLPPNTLVLGVVGNGEQRAYPLSMLHRYGGVLNDDLAGVPIVVLSSIEQGSYAALAFSRRLGDRVLFFDGTQFGPVDRQTGSVWTIGGKAISGPLKAQGLPFIQSHVAEWFVWAANYPNIGIHP